MPYQTGILAFVILGFPISHLLTSAFGLSHIRNSSIQHSRSP